MFGLTGIKAVIALVTISVVLGAWYGIKTYMANHETMKAQIVEMTLTNNALIGEVREGNDNFESYQVDMSDQLNQYDTRINHLNNEFTASRAKVTELEALLSKHDLTKLALTKPKMLTKGINKATKALFDEIEKFTIEASE
jgi:predicted RNase H-like nuclease (RuvC/YqgF family)